MLTPTALSDNLRELYSVALAHGSLVESMVPSPDGRRLYDKGCGMGVAYEYMWKGVTALYPDGELMRSDALQRASLLTALSGHRVVKDCSRLLEACLACYSELADGYDLGVAHELLQGDEEALYNFCCAYGPFFRMEEEVAGGGALLEELRSLIGAIDPGRATRLLHSYADLWIDSRYLETLARFLTYLEQLLVSLLGIPSDLFARAIQRKAEDDGENDRIVYGLARPFDSGRLRRLFDVFLPGYLLEQKSQTALPLEALSRLFKGKKLQLVMPALEQWVAAIKAHDGAVAPRDLVAALRGYESFIHDTAAAPPRKQRSLDEALALLADMGLCDFLRRPDPLHCQRRDALKAGDAVGVQGNTYTLVDEVLPAPGDGRFFRVADANGLLLWLGDTPWEGALRHSGRQAAVGLAAADIYAFDLDSGAVLVEELPDALLGRQWQPCGDKLGKENGDWLKPLGALVRWCVDNNVTLGGLEACHLRFAHNGRLKTVWPCGAAPFDYQALEKILWQVTGGEHPLFSLLMEHCGLDALAEASYYREVVELAVEEPLDEAALDGELSARAALHGVGASVAFLAAEDLYKRWRSSVNALHQSVQRRGVGDLYTLEQVAAALYEEYLGRGCVSLLPRELIEAAAQRLINP